MRRMLLLRPLLAAASLLAAGCGDAIEDNHFADDVREERAESRPLVAPPVAVRVGELGPNFPACNAIGTTRNLAEGQGLPLRAAPFDNADQIGSIASGSRFFICSRSIDQKWLGVVLDDAGASPACGVSAPAPRRRDYAGPCRSGWVSGPLVKFISGIDSVQAQPSVAN